jgi:hypothetical protein
MNHDYSDIRDKIKETPLWYDQNGVPRYAPFHPKYCPNIYADKVALLRIACQNCGVIFFVEMHSDVFGTFRHPKNLHYGDPPAHHCTGDSMNSCPRAVVQMWTRDRDPKSPTFMDWLRHRDLEGEIT